MNYIPTNIETWGGTRSEGMGGIEDTTEVSDAGTLFIDGGSAF